MPARLLHTSRPTAGQAFKRHCSVAGEIGCCVGPNRYMRAPEVVVTSRLPGVAMCTLVPGMLIKRVLQIVILIPNRQSRGDSKKTCTK